VIISNSADDPIASNTVDVVIPTFNETKNLVRAINSVKNQTSKVNRIFVIDDGSKEDVKKFLSEVYKSDNLVKLILKEHSGLPGVSRNLGISLSNADWIAFLDADDYWDPRKLELQLELAQTMPSDFVFSNATMVDGKHRSPYFEQGSFASTIGLRELLKSNSVINSSVLVRRNLLERIGPYPESPKVRGVEDYATWLRASTIAKLHGTSDCLVYYQVSPTSLSRVEKSITRTDAQQDFESWLKVKFRNRPALIPILLTVLLNKVEVFVNQKIDQFKASRKSTDSQ
jgi:glycosyltransferase involved in cell wall biosynthesis